LGEAFTAHIAGGKRQFGIRSGHGDLGAGHGRQTKIRGKANPPRLPNCLGQFVKVMGTHSWSNWGWFWTAKCEISTGLVEYWAHGVACVVIEKIT
jgi:hypothetical protein